MTTDTTRSLFSNLTPIMLATSFATEACPTVHPLTAAFPSTTACAKPLQPGWPHAPQFAPGRTSLILSIRGSTLTANLSEAMANPIPKNMPNVIAAPKSNSICFSYLYSKTSFESISNPSNTFDFTIPFFLDLQNSTYPSFPKIKISITFSSGNTTQYSVTPYFP